MGGSTGDIHMAPLSFDEDTIDFDVLMIRPRGFFYTRIRVMPLGRQTRTFSGSYGRALVDAESLGTRSQS